MTREEIAEAAKVASQIAVEQVIRDAAEFGWASATEGRSLNEVRVDSVLLAHDRITGLVGELLKAGSIVERAS